MSRVIICEDDGILAHDLAAIVENAGHVVTGIFSAGSAALAAIPASGAAIAIVDLSLTDGDTGGEVARAAEAAGMRVIVVSGHSNVGQGLGFTSHTYAQKPWDETIIRQLLSGSLCELDLRSAIDGTADR
jgi:ActR/RegA family two-component response regulator